MDQYSREEDSKSTESISRSFYKGGLCAELIDRIRKQTHTIQCKIIAYDELSGAVLVRDTEAEYWRR